MQRRGFLLVIEGCDSVGKGTVKDGIMRHLRQTFSLSEKTMKIEINCLRQPSDEARKEINTVSPSNWLRMLYLFMKDREEQFHRELRSFLEDKKIVLMDRFYHSSCVYQGMMGNLSPVEILNAHGPWAIKPDLTLVLYVDPDELEERLSKRGEALEKLEGDRGVRIEIQRRYADLCNGKHLGFEECVLIDAAGKPKEVLKRCLDVVQQHLQPWLEIEES